MSSESPGASPARPAFSSLPVLTLPPPGCSRAAEAAFAAELREVCHTVGFFYVAGIDAFVSPTTRRDALAAATRFFAMPQEKKDAMDYRNSPAFRGYVRLGAENTAGLPDLREQVEFGVEAETHPKATDAPPYARLRGPNQWPNEIDCPRFRENASRFSDEARALSTRLTRLLALSLDLPADAFDGVFGDAPNVQMKIARYPPRMTAGMERRRRTDANANENDEAAAFGVGAHTDSGFLSLLLQDDVGGLQVMNGAGEWVDAPPVENTLVVNLGEMLQLATRGYYLATPHRVLLPDTHTSPERGVRDEHRARLSVPYFWNPKLEYVCEPMDLPPSVRWTRAGAPTAAFAAAAAKAQKEKKKEKKKNPLLEAYGANALKSLARSHPEVMARHHPDLVVGEDGAVARRTSARAYRE
jgi:isopenicillin N synthase-like dioxygenase